MNDLYKKSEYELEKLTRLVAHARDNNQPVAADDAIIEQSQKVDLLIERLVKQCQSKK